MNNGTGRTRNDTMPKPRPGQEQERCGRFGKVLHNGTIADGRHEMKSLQEQSKDVQRGVRQHPPQGKSWIVTSVPKPQTLTQLKRYPVK